MPGSHSGHTQRMHFQLQHLKYFRTHLSRQRKSQINVYLSNALTALFAHPVSGNQNWTLHPAGAQFPHHRFTSNS